MPTKDRTARPFALRAAVTLLATLAVSFLLLLGACALPGAPVRAHLEPSARQIAAEGLYPSYFGCKLFQMDNYTDTLMLFTAATADESDPLTAMMTNTVYNMDDFVTLADVLTEYLARRAIAEGAEGHPDPTVTLRPTAYARYWHGYLIWLRPLLLVLTYGQIRILDTLVLIGLYTAVYWQLRRRCGARPALWFVVSQLLVTVFFVPRQLQFFTTFAIAYAGCLWVLRRHRPLDSLCLGLLALGAVTAFCDLLVTPILTLGLPLTVWLLRPAQRGRAGLPQCAAVAAGALCWGTGYGICWAAKWVLASLLTGNDIIGDALRQIGVRTAGATWHGMTLSWGNILGYVFGTLQSRGLLWPLLALAVLAVAAFCLCLRGRAALARALPLALVALMPLLWFAVLRGHSIQHGWFTWRALGVTLFAGFGFLQRACDVRLGWQRLKNIARRAK